MRTWLLLLCSALGCGSSVGGFTGARTLSACDNNYLVCNTSAGCALTESDYIEGKLPGLRRVIFRNDAPGPVRVGLLFTQELSPGKMTIIEWNEVGCTSQQSFSSMGRDIFQLAGDAQQLVAEQPLTTVGDHLIVLDSDATAQYQLIIEQVR
jgi:hypothetical protein